MRDLSERHIVIDALVVQQSHWRRGVGRALVEAVETWATDTGAFSVKVTRYASSPVSTTFFEALGIRLVATTVDTQGPLTVLAADCEAKLDGEKLDCSTATVSEELG